MRVGEVWREKHRKQNIIEILKIDNDDIWVFCLISNADATFKREEFIQLFEKEWANENR